MRLLTDLSLLGVFLGPLSLMFFLKSYEAHWLAYAGIVTSIYFGWALRELTERLSK